MKIPGYYNPQIGKAYQQDFQKAQRKKPGSGSGKLKEGAVVLSSQTAGIRKFAELAKSITEIRQEKIENAKRQIKSKTYVDSEAVARSIIDLLG